MNIRLIAGKLGGRTIKTPDGHVTHPMSERVRGSLFNKIVDEIDGAEVLDAFAGAGSLGFEALSRNAKSVVFVERDRNASQILLQNAKVLGVELTSNIFQMGLSTWINNNTDSKFDLIFADPPYNNMQLSTVERLFGLLKPNGLMVLSYPGSGEVPRPTGVVVVDNRGYGNAALIFYRLVE